MSTSLPKVSRQLRRASAGPSTDVGSAFRRIAALSVVPGQRSVHERLELASLQRMVSRAARTSAAPTTEVVSRVRRVPESYEALGGRSAAIGVFSGSAYLAELLADLDGLAARHDAGFSRLSSAQRSQYLIALEARLAQREPAAPRRAKGFIDRVPKALIRARAALAAAPHDPQADRVFDETLFAHLCQTDVSFRHISVEMLTTNRATKTLFAARKATFLSLYPARPFAKETQPSR